MRHFISFHDSFQEARLLRFATPTPEKPDEQVQGKKVESGAPAPQGQREVQDTATGSVTRAHDDVQGVRRNAETTTSGSPDVVRRDPTVRSAEQGVEGAIRSVEGPAAATVEKDAQGNTTITFELPAGNGEWPDMSYQAPGHTSSFQRCDGQGRILDRNTVSTGNHSESSPYFMQREKTANGYRYTIQADPGVVFKVAGVNLTPKKQAEPAPAPASEKPAPATKVAEKETPSRRKNGRKKEVSQGRKKPETTSVTNEGETMTPDAEAARSKAYFENYTIGTFIREYVLKIRKAATVENIQELLTYVKGVLQSNLSTIAKRASQKDNPLVGECARQNEILNGYVQTYEPMLTKVTQESASQTAPERTRNPELKGALDQLEFHLSAGHGMGTEVDAALRRLNDSLKGKTREQRMAALIAVGLASEQVSTDTNLREQRFTPRTVKDENNNVEYRIFTDLEGSTVQVEMVEPAVQPKETVKETVESDSALLKKAQSLFGTRIDILEKDGGSGAAKLVEAVNALIDQMTDAGKKTAADTLMGGRKTVTYVNGEQYNVRFTKTSDGHIALEDLANVDSKLAPEIRRGYMDAVAALRSGEDAKAAQGILDGITNAALEKMSPEGRARVLDQVFGKVGMEFNEGTFHVKFTHDRMKVTIQDLATGEAESRKPTERSETQPSVAPDGVDTNVDINNPESVARDLEQRMLGRYEGAEQEFRYVPLRVGFAGKDAKGRNIYRITCEESTDSRNATMSKVATYAEKHGLVAPGTKHTDARQIDITITGFEKGFGYTGPWHKNESTPDSPTPTVADNPTDLSLEQTRNRFTMIKGMLDTQRETFDRDGTQRSLDTYRESVQTAIANRRAYIRDRAAEPGVDKANDALLSELRAQIIELQNDYLQPYADKTGTETPAASPSTKPPVAPAVAGGEAPRGTVDRGAERRESVETPEQRYARAKEEQRIKRDVETKYGEATDQWATLESGKMDFDKKNPQPYLYKKGTLEGKPVLLAYAPKGGMQIMDMKGNWRFMRDLNDKERTEMQPVEDDIKAKYASLMAAEQQKPTFKARSARNAENHRMEEECLTNPKADANWFRSKGKGDAMWAQNQDVKSALERSLQEAQTFFTSVQRPAPGGSTPETPAPTPATPKAPEQAPAGQSESKENEALRRENEELKRQIAELTKQIADLLARIKALEDQQKKPATPEAPKSNEPVPATPEAPKSNEPVPATPEAPKAPENKEAIDAKIKALEAENGALTAEWAKILEGGHAALHTKDPQTGKEGIVRLEEIVKKKEENDREIARLKAQLAAPEAKEGLPESTDALIAERKKLNDEIGGLRTKLDSASMSRIQAIDQRIAAIDGKLSEIRVKLETELKTLSGKTDQASMDRVKAIDAEITKINAVVPPSATPAQSPENVTEDARIAKLPPLERAKFEAATTEWGTIGAVGAVDLKGAPYLYRKATVTVNGTKETRLFAYGDSGYNTLDLTTGQWKKMANTDPMITEASLGDAPAKYAALPNKPGSIPGKERLKFNAAGPEWARMGAKGTLDKVGVPFLYRKGMVTVNGAKTARLFAYTQNSGYWMMDEKGTWAALKPQDPMITEAGLGDAQAIYAKLDNAPYTLPEKERVKFNAATTYWAQLGTIGNVDKARMPYLYIKADVPTDQGKTETRLFAYTQNSGYNVMDRNGRWTKITATDPMIVAAGIGYADKVKVQVA